MNEVMEERPPPSPKLLIFPILFATGLAGGIHFAAPQLGYFAPFSAWVGAFFMLWIWGIITR